MHRNKRGRRKVTRANAGISRYGDNGLKAADLEETKAFPRNLEMALLPTSSDFLSKRQRLAYTIILIPLQQSIYLFSETLFNQKLFIGKQYHALINKNIPAERGCFHDLNSYKGGVLVQHKLHQVSVGFAST